MNYYPYFNGIPYTAMPAKTSFINSIFKGVNLSSIINGTQKTLNIVNQTIPLIKQAGPVFNNAKTMFRVMNEFKRFDINDSVNNQINRQNIDEKINNEEKTKKEINSSGPTFFQ